MLRLLFVALLQTDSISPEKLSCLQLSYFLSCHSSEPPCSSPAPRSEQSRRSLQNPQGAVVPGTRSAPGTCGWGCEQSFPALLGAKRAFAWVSSGGWGIRSEAQTPSILNMLILVAGQYLTWLLIQCCLAPFVSLLLPSHILLFPSVMFNKHNMLGATADLLSQSVSSSVTQTWSQLQKKNDDVCLSRFEPLQWVVSQMWYGCSVITETAVCHKLLGALMD